MRSVGAFYAAALAAARTYGLAPRDLLWVVPRDFDTGEEVDGIGFWSGDDVVDILVIDPETGGSVLRTYTGGVGLNVGEIAETSDLSVQTVSIEISAIADAVQELMRGYDTRLARVEIHSLLLDAATRDPVDEAEPVFVGVVDESSIGTASSGGESLLQITVVDDALLMLTRSNAAKRSDEHQKTRSGDRMNRYSNSVGSWEVYWGRTKQGGS